MVTHACALLLICLPATQTPTWTRSRIGESPLTLALPAPLTQAENAMGLSVYSRADDVKAWTLKSGSLEFIVQVFPKDANPNFDPKRAVSAAEALAKTGYGERLRHENIVRASSIEGGMQIEEVVLGVQDEKDPQKKIAYGYWAAWDGEWGCVSRYSFEPQDLETAQRLVSSRRFLDLASGSYRFQTGYPGLRFLLPCPMGAGDETRLHNPEWFVYETTYEGKLESTTFRFSQLEPKKTLVLDLVLVEKALKWQAEGQKKEAEVTGVKCVVDRSPLAGQKIVRAVTDYTLKGKKRRAVAYGFTVGAEVWCLLALFDPEDIKAAAAVQKVWDSAKLVGSEPVK